VKPHWVHEKIVSFPTKKYLWQKLIQYDLPPYKYSLNTVWYKPHHKKKILVNEQDRIYTGNLWIQIKCLGKYNVQKYKKTDKLHSLKSWHSMSYWRYQIKEDKMACSLNGDRSHKMLLGNLKACDHFDDVNVRIILICKYNIKMYL
jgi:hypothetical protein